MILSAGKAGSKLSVLGQREIPALVVDADTEDCLVMSLVENLARRQHRAIDLLQDIEGLKQRGYNETDIAAKTGLTLEYVKGVIRLAREWRTSSVARGRSRANPGQRRG